MKYSLSMYARFIASALVILIGLWCPGCTSETSAAEAAPPGCDTLSTKNVISPNGAWEASIAEIGCEFGYAFPGVAEYLVSLTAVSNPKTTATIFVVNDSGPETRPMLFWIYGHKLRIASYAHEEGNGAIELHLYGNISIAYKIKTYDSCDASPRCSAQRRFFQNRSGGKSQTDTAFGR